MIFGVFENMIYVLEMVGPYEENVLANKERIWTKLKTPFIGDKFFDALKSTM